MLILGTIKSDTLHKIKIFFVEGEQFNRVCQGGSCDNHIGNARSFRVMLPSQVK